MTPAQSFIDLVEKFEPMYRHSDKIWKNWLQVLRRWRTDVTSFDWLVDKIRNSAARRKRRREFGRIVNWFSWPVSAWMVC